MTWVATLLAIKEQTCHTGHTSHLLKWKWHSDAGNPQQPEMKQSQSKWIKMIGQYQLVPALFMHCQHNKWSLEQSFLTAPHPVWWAESFRLFLVTTSVREWLLSRSLSASLSNHFHEKVLKRWNLGLTWINCEQMSPQVSKRFESRILYSQTHY